MPGGTIHLTVDSPHQPGPTAVRVLQPASGAAPSRVLYILPVEPGIGGRFGDGLEEIRRHDLHERFGFAAVCPEFVQMPWYIDHPTDPTRQQEAHLLDVVLPLVDAALGLSGPRPGSRTRLLLGFSKSGWGAVSMMLRHPQVFVAAALWDAPLMAEQPAQGWAIEALLDDDAVGDSFRRHALPDRLREHGRVFGNRLSDQPRLVLLAGGHHAPHMTAAHALLTDLHIPHAWLGPFDVAHTWHTGWVASAIESLMAIAP